MAKQMAKQIDRKAKAAKFLWDHCVSLGGCAPKVSYAGSLRLEIIDLKLFYEDETSIKHCHKIHKIEIETEKKQVKGIVRSCP